MPVTSYPNVVLALHAYTHFCTIDHLAPQLVSSAAYPWGGYDQSYALAEHEARAMDAALFVSEFGNPPGDDGRLLAAQILEQEAHNVGFAFWTWKENGAGGWGVYAPAQSSQVTGGCLRGDRERLLARAYPRATPAIRLAFHHDSSNGGFDLHAVGRAGDPPTIVYVPSEVAGKVTIGGGARGIVIDQSDGSRMVLVTTGGGPFDVDIAAAPLALSAC
jgi:hypothetical protein